MSLLKVPIDIIQFIGFKINSTQDYLSLALCCKQTGKLLTKKDLRLKAIIHFTKIVEKVDQYGKYKEWTINGKIHREDGPAKIWASGDKYWYINGKLHREDGPAKIWADGSKFWYINGKRHREGGPAMEYASGDKFWYINGKRHREDGPALYANGYKFWYINGKKLSESEFNKRNN